MNTFVLVPGAGGDAWYWHRVVPLLEAHGHLAIAVDLPAADDDAGLERYVETIVAAAAAADDIVMVGQSMGGLSAPIASERLPVTQLVLVNAMIPRPGETGGDWWANTGHTEARAAHARAIGRSDLAFDPLVDFLHDVPRDVLDAALGRGEPNQSGRPFEDPWPLAAWPDIPTAVLAGADDRFFPAGFQQRIAHERLGLAAEIVPGGHLAALSQPQPLADRLVEFARRGFRDAP